MPERVPRNTDLDANTVNLITRVVESEVVKTIDERQQRRQYWGPTFKQEGISNLEVTSADFEIPAPEYGKRTLILNGTLGGTGIVRLPKLPTAWWFIINNTNQAIRVLNAPDGTVGPLVGLRQTATVITDGMIVFRSTGEEYNNVKMLPDGVATPLFKVQFAAGDMKGVAGRVELFLKAYSATQIAVYIATVYFVALHHTSSAASYGRWGLSGESVAGAPVDLRLGDFVSSFGGVTWEFSCNSVVPPSYANPISDAFTYALKGTSGSMGPPVTLDLRYVVYPQGDLSIQLL